MWFVKEKKLARREKERGWWEWVKERLYKLKSRHLPRVSLSYSVSLNPILKSTKK